MKTKTKYDPTTPLYDLPDREFETGGLITNAVKAGGHINSAITVISSYYWWGRPLGEVLADLEEMRRASTLADLDRLRQRFHREAKGLKG